MNDYEKLLTKMRKQKHQLRILINKITDYKQEIDKLKNELEELEKNHDFRVDQAHNLQKRIDKAIEYIKVSHTLKCTKPNVIFEITNEKLDKLLEILGDSSNV